MRDPTQGRRLLAASYAELDRMADAKIHAAAILAAQPDFTISDWAKKQPDQDPAMLALLVRALRKAGLPD
jgi:hypothetical protein